VNFRVYSLNYMLNQGIHSNHNKVKDYHYLRWSILFPTNVLKWK